MRILFRPLFIMALLGSLPANGWAQQNDSNSDAASQQVAPVVPMAPDALADQNSDTAGSQTPASLTTDALTEQNSAATAAPPVISFGPQDVFISKEDLPVAPEPADATSEAVAEKGEEPVLIEGSDDPGDFSHYKTKSIKEAVAERKKAKALGEEPAPVPATVADAGSEDQPQEQTAVAEGQEPQKGKKEGKEKPAFDKRRFIKGELIYPGTRRLLSRFDHIGIGIGATLLDGDLWATITPGMALYFKFGLGISFQAPLKLKAMDINGTEYSFGGMKVRKEDWDEISDYAKVIRFITYGRKEANIYATINTMRPSTIGHGLLMKGYQGDIDIDRSLTGLLLDMYNRYAGFEFQLNDITFQNQIFAVLGFIKPLAFASKDDRISSLSLGIEYIADNRAPKSICTDSSCKETMRGEGHQAGFDPYTGLSLDHSFVRTNPDNKRFAVNTTLVHAIGTSIEFKFVKTQTTDLKVFGTYHKYLNEGGGHGGSLGLLARLTFGDTWLNAFRFQAEYRLFGDGYMPAYFNTMYEITKYAYLTNAKRYQTAATKYQQVFGDPENGFARQEFGISHGYNVELHWGLFKQNRSAKKIAAGIGLSDSTRPNDTSLYAHLEFPMLEWLQIFGSYMVFDADGFKDAFTNQSNMVVMAGLRLQILPVLFINAHYAHTFRVLSTPGSEIHLGNINIVDANGNPSNIFTQDDLYEPVHTVMVELEFGWELMHKNKKDKKGKK